MLREFVGFMAILRYEPCTQFINVLQRALHIYWQFSAMSRITAKVKTVICEQAPNHGSYFAYARLIARVNFQFSTKDTKDQIGVEEATE